MPEAVLKLYGDIGEPDKLMEMFGVVDDTVSAKIVSEFIDNNKDADTFVIRINSRGGDVQEGWAIYDLLSSSGKKIRTIGEGKIYSIATVIFLAGTERDMMKNADGLIHNPYIPQYTLADQYESGDLLKIAEGLKQEEEKILDFYVEKTGTAREKLAGYMKEDTKLSAEDMLTLGFATKIIEPVKAFAFINPKNSIMTEKDVKTFGEKIDTLIAKFAAFSRLAPIAQVLKDKDGKEFKLEKESGAPAVGDKATPDGTFVMADGKTIKIVNGEISEIVEAVVTEDMLPKADLDLAKSKIAELETLIGDTEAKKQEVITAKADADKVKAEALALVDELKALKNTWKPEGRQRFTTIDKVGDVDLKKAKELYEKIKTE